MDFELKATDPSVLDRPGDELLSPEELCKQRNERVLEIIKKDADECRRLEQLERERKESEAISSDTDSWEILDEDHTSMDESESIKKPDDDAIDKSEENILNEGVQKILASASPFLPPLDDGDQESLPSVLSDGIPIAEDLSEGKPQYLWNDDLEEEVEEATEAISLNSSDTIIPQEDKNESMTCSTNSLDSVRSDRTKLFLALETRERNQDQMDDAFPHLRKNLEQEEAASAVSSEESDLDVDDIEIIPAIRESDIITKYPSEELPEEFAEAMIQRGRTYSHQRNQQVNITLTAVVIVVVAMVVGLGVGHFLGWSERLELQEQFAEVREEKLENLAESLVTCMTGEEGKGGDDQDLDDRVIKQLWVENKELKDELQLLQSYRDESTARKIENELNTILRDRVNDLMSANADLEREVAKLRYAHSAIKEKEESNSKLEQTSSDLFQAKESLNEIAIENDQLKIAVVKARYSAPPIEISVDEKAKINELRTENDELRREIRKVRYLPLPYKDSASPMFDNVEQYDPETTTEEEEEENVDYASYSRKQPDTDDQLPAGLPETILSSKQIFPDLLSAGTETPERSFEVSLPLTSIFQEESKLEEKSKPKGEEEALESFTTTLDRLLDELPFVPDEQEDGEKERTKSREPEKKSRENFFGNLADIVLNTTGQLLQDAPVDIVRMITNINKKAKRVFNEENMKKFSDLANSAEKVLLQKWEEIAKFTTGENANKHSLATKKAVEKLTKTFKNSLNVLKESLKTEQLDESWDKIQEFMHRKWQTILNKFQAVIKDQEKEKSPPKRDTKWAYSYGTVEQEESSIDSSNNNTRWMFSRAKKRTDFRKESKKSDWIFDRANYRKRFHNMNNADWHSKRLFNQKCSEFDNECSTIGNLNEAEINRIYKKNKNTNKESIIDMRDKKNIRRNKKGETDEKPKNEDNIIHFLDDLDFFEDEFDDDFIVDGGGGRQWKKYDNFENQRFHKKPSYDKLKKNNNNAKRSSTKERRKNSRYKYHF